MKEKGSVGLVVVAVPAGVLLGLAFFTFGYARGHSYLTDDPEACVNCHVMRDQYQSWLRSSHRRAAVCNDCHTPSGAIPKYMTKATNGFYHSLAFTVGRFPDEIRIKDRNARVAEAACLKCHEDVTVAMRMVRGGRHEVSCIACHRHVGHAE
jgi:cytochrome c nitrite reductase small subunit